MVFAWASGVGVAGGFVIWSVRAPGLATVVRLRLRSSGVRDCRGGLGMYDSTLEVNTFRVQRSELVKLWFRC